MEEDLEKSAEAGFAERLVKQVSFDLRPGLDEQGEYDAIALFAIFNPQDVSRKKHPFRAETAYRPRMSQTIDIMPHFRSCRGCF
jgi:hypothetical protein